jgi:hypothetical protein
LLEEVPGFAEAFVATSAGAVRTEVDGLTSNFVDGNDVPGGFGNDEDREEVNVRGFVTGLGMGAATGSDVISMAVFGADGFHLHAAEFSVGIDDGIVR